MPQFSSYPTTNALDAADTFLVHKDATGVERQIDAATAATEMIALGGGLIPGPAGPAGPAGPTGPAGPIGPPGTGISTTGPIRSYLMKNISGVITLPGDTVWKGPYVYNVKDYGATGDGVMDDSFAINLAIADANTVSAGATLYFPSGTYLISSGLTKFNTNSIHMAGDGPNVSILKINHASSIMVEFEGINGKLSGIGFITALNRNENSPIVVVDGCSLFKCDDLQNSSSGDWIYVTGGNWFFMENVFSRCAQVLEGIHLRSRGPSLIMNNVVLSNDNTYGLNTRAYPTLVIEGSNTTGLKISNCSFSGVGPLYKFSGSTLTSTPTTFTVDFGTAHDIGINEYIVISGCSNAGYNTFWRVASVTANTVTISSNLNLGSDTASTVTTIPAAAIVTNKYGSINESEFTNVMFEAVGYPTTAVSCGLFMDGTKSNGQISGWKLNSCYFDAGNIGCLLTGGGLSGISNTTRRIQINGGQMEGNFRLVDISMANGILINQIQGPGYDVYTAPPAGINAAVYVYAPSGQVLGGIHIQNSNIGGPAAWTNDVNLVFDYGIYFDGQAEDVIVTGCTIQGSVGAVYYDPTTYDKTKRTSGNIYFVSASAPPSGVSDLPVIAAATVITIPWNDTIRLTSGSDIDTIQGAWVGRIVTFVNQGPGNITFKTGGAAPSISTNINLSANHAINFVFTGTNWYPTQ